MTLQASVFTSVTMATSPIRLAILEADIPIGATRTKYGSYGGVFTSLLHKAADASSIPRERLEITGWDVVNPDREAEGKEEDMGGEWNWKRRKGYPKLEEVDAVLITGSRMWVPSFSHCEIDRRNACNVGGRKLE